MPKIAVANMDVDKKEWDQLNVEEMCRWVDQAADQGADLIVFPESSVAGLCPDREASYLDAVAGSFTGEEAYYYSLGAEYLPEGQVCQAFMKKAKEKDVHIIYGHPERSRFSSDIYWNTSVLVGPEGFIGSYHKAHLPGTELIMPAGGEEVPVYDTKIGKIGMIICYDLVFPELCRVLALKGAQIIACSTGWPCHDKTNDEKALPLDLVKSMAKVRAYENLVYFAISNAANPGAVGHSQIISPGGEVIAETGYEEGMAIADIGEINHAMIGGRTAKSDGLNFLKFRRPDLYKEITELSPWGYYSNPDFMKKNNG